MKQEEIKLNVKGRRICHIKPERSCEDLEKYASRAGFDYVDDIESKYPNHRWNDHDVEFAYRDGIIAGAEWRREQPSEDLEAEIEKFLASEDSTSYDNAGTYKVSFKDPIKIARHFYELGKQSKESVSEDLEEAAKKHASFHPAFNYKPMKAAFIAGAEWQKEQMLKEAVEFECIGKNVKMTVKELIDYYIDTECCEVAEECGF